MAALTARIRLSVPPEVMNPAASPSEPAQERARATTSFCMRLSEGKASVFRAFSPEKRLYASSASATASGPALYARVKARPSRHRTSRVRMDSISASTSSTGRPGPMCGPGTVELMAEP